MSRTTILLWVLLLVGAAALLGLASVAANVWMVLATREAIYSEVARIPPRPTGLILGTSPYTQSGRPNPYFHNRVKAAVQLYRAGKIRHILVSGANPSQYYNEPQAMFDALREAGIPAAAITPDYAGYRTLDSVIRAQRVFGQNELTLISQRYHDYRALFVAWQYGIDAIAFAAPQVGLKASLELRFREFLARLWAVLDVFVFNTQPRYLGPQVEIDVDTGVERLGENGSRGGPMEDVDVVSPNKKR